MMLKRLRNILVFIAFILSNVTYGAEDPTKSSQPNQAAQAAKPSQQIQSELPPQAKQPEQPQQPAGPGDAARGKAKTEVCTACHGPDGNSVNPIWPKIAGQSYKYLVKQLIEYRKGQQGDRFDPVMFGMVQSLSDQDINDLAAFYSTQTETAGSAKPEGIELGKRLYQGGDPAKGIPACGPSCHGMLGEGLAAAGIPKLSGQQIDYTIDQLKKFRSDARKDDVYEIMRDIAKRMSDEEIKAVSNYVAGLH